MITSSVQTNPQARTESATGSRGRAVRTLQPSGQAEPALAEAPAPAAWDSDSDSELKYFHRGLHRLRGPGPGYRIVILSGASEDRPLPVPSQTVSREGSESQAAASGAGATARGRRPEPLAGGTATLQEILDTVLVPAPAVVESDELSLPDLARDNEDWDSCSAGEAEDPSQPDPY